MAYQISGGSFKVDQETLETINYFCNFYGVKFQWNDKNNRSFADISERTIVISKFSPNKLATFFHELGHILDPELSSDIFRREVQAWRIAKKVANLYGIEKLGKDLMSFCLSSYLTYLYRADYVPSGFHQLKIETKKAVEVNKKQETLKKKNKRNERVRAKINLE